MTVVATSVTVTTTATQLTGADAGGSHDPHGQSLMLQAPAGGATIYLGGEGVTTATGFPVAAGEPFTADLRPGDVLYGVVASGSQAVNVLRVGV